jgi:hypothetical protein
VGTLRSKIEAGKTPRYLITERSLGYPLIPSPSISEATKAGCLPKGMNADCFPGLQARSRIILKCEQKRTDDASKGQLLSTQGERKSTLSS